MEQENVFLSGNEALARGAYEEGLKVACSYPGAPATEILEYLSGCDGVDSQWSVNEKAAFEIALAASIGGVRSLYSSKHTGLNAAMSPLMACAYTGVGAGFVVVSCDDPGPHSSQNEQDSRLIARFAKIPLLEPSSPRESKELMSTAFAVSEEFDLPVMVRLTTRIAHTKENMTLGIRKDIPKKEYKTDIGKYVLLPGNARKRHMELEKKIARLKVYADSSHLNKMEINDTQIGFITGGVSYLYVKEMYPQASILKLGMSFPFPSQMALEFAKKVKKVFIAEELEPYLEEELRLIGIECTGKTPTYRIGELRPEDIPDITAQKDRADEPSLARKPVMCPGCPHRQVFHVLKKLKVTVAGDIGCYTLGALPPLESMHTCLCIGAGVTFFEGLTRALGNNVVGVIGDSTFAHSGITGLINLSYNKVKGLILILDNGTTAMTGNQPHPACGVTVKGERTKRLVLEEICNACGAETVDVADPYDVMELEELIAKRMKGGKLSVVIVRYPCRLIDKRKAPAPLYDAGSCDKCYLCLSVGCPAIRKSDGGLIMIGKDLCVGCGLCVEVCEPKALKKNDGK